MSAILHAAECKCAECKRRRNEPETSTCDCCGRRRVCKQVLHYESTPRTYDPHYCLAQCIDLTATERDKVRAEMRALRKKKAPPLAWPIIGGALDGQYAVPADFHGEGRYSDYGRYYAEFNTASRSAKRIGASPSMVFIHVALLKPMIRGADR